MPGDQFGSTRGGGSGILMDVHSILLMTLEHGAPSPRELAMRRQRFGRFLLLAAAVPLTVLVAAAQSEDDAGFIPVTDAMLEDPAPGDWLMWRRTQNGWGYSPLDQVNRYNVADLRLVWTRALAQGAQEGTPLA